MDATAYCLHPILICISCIRKSSLTKVFFFASHFCFWSTKRCQVRMREVASVSNVIKLLRKKSTVCPNVKQQNRPFLKKITFYNVHKHSNSIHCFHNFVLVQVSEQTFLGLLSLGKSRFHPKKFYCNDHRSQRHKQIYSNIASLLWNKALWFVENSYETCNSQSECFIST